MIIVYPVAKSQYRLICLHFWLNFTYLQQMNNKSINNNKEYIYVIYAYANPTLFLITFLLEMQF